MTSQTTEAWDVTWEDVSWGWDNFTVSWENDSTPPTTEIPLTTRIVNLPDTPPITVTRFAMGILLSLIIPVSVFGNTIVLSAIFSNRSLQRPNTMMYISLSVSDFLRTLFCMPIYAYSLFSNQWGIADELCPFYHSFYIMLRSVTVLNLSVISVERLVSITKPLTYHRIASKTRMLKLIAAIWLLSLTYGSLNILWFYGEDPDLSGGMDQQTVNIPCRFTPALGFLIFDFFLTFIIPLIVMLCVYMKIFLVVQSQMRRLIATVGPEIQRDSLTQEYSSSNMHRESVSQTSAQEYNGCNNINKELASHTSVQEYPGCNNKNRKLANQTAILEYNSDSSDSNQLHNHLSTYSDRSYNSLELSEAADTDRCCLQTELVTTKQQRSDNTATGHHHSDYVTDHTVTSIDEEGEVNIRRLSGATDSSKLGADLRQRAGSECFLLKEIKPTLARASYGVIHRHVQHQKSSADIGFSSGGTEIPRIVVDSTYGSLESGATGTSCAGDESHRVSRVDIPPAVRKPSFRASTAKSRREPHLHENKALKLSVAVIGTFVFCFAPYEITFVVERSCPTCVGDVAWMTVNTLAFLSAALNPFVYSLYGTEFRMAMKNLLCYCRGKAVSGM